MEGAPLGTKLGIAEGPELGMELSEPLGAKEGASLATTLGTADGSRLGSELSEGVREGTSLGMED